MKKRLFKSERDKLIAGVCGGLGKFIGIDPTLIRVAWALFVLLGGVGLIAYIVCAFIMPKAEAGEEDYIIDDGRKKRLYRAKNGAKILGVCQGISNTYGFDVTLIRVLVTIVCCFGIGIIAYFIAGFIIPIEGEN